jgi:MFS family permease
MTNERALPAVPKRLGWLHFANDFTLDFLTPLLPGVVPVAWIGLMEGLANGVGQLLKLFAGRASDRSGKRVFWVRSGYGVNAVLRPLAAVGMFFGWPLWIIACRVGDRIGKGLRGSASDALVTDWTEGGAQRAHAFATMRTMDHLGAAAGGLCAAGAVYLWSQHLPWLVAALAVPAIAMLWWCKGLSDTDKPAPSASAPPVGWWPGDRSVQAPLFVIGLASLASHIGPLLILVHVSGMDLDGNQKPWPLWLICLGWAAFGFIQAGAAAVAGRFTERLGPRQFLVIGYLIGAAIFAALAIAHSHWLIAAGVAFGIFTGAMEGTEKTYIAALAPKHERALSFGALALLVAIAEIVGNGLCGLGLSSAFGPETFLIAAAILACAGLVLAVRGDPKDSSNIDTSPT